MWGRISNLAEMADAALGGTESNDEGSQEEDSSESGRQKVEGAATPSSVMSGDEDVDGWGDDDDFGDDDLDFDDGDAVDVEQPVENGVKELHTSSAAGDHNTFKKEEVPHNDNDVEIIESNANGKINNPVDAITTTMKNISVEAKKTHTHLTQIAEAKQTTTSTTVHHQTQIAAIPQSPKPRTNNNDYPNIVTVSAPGKALIAGGYLVLESPNPGLVLAAEGCRFHTTITFRPPYTEKMNSTSLMTVIGNSVNASWESIPLDVYSPQFDRVFSYYLSYPLTLYEEEEDENGSMIQLQPRRKAHESNVFVERSLLLALGYLHKSLGAEAFHARLQLHRSSSSNGGVMGSERVALAIKLRADNDFYSQITRLRERGLDLTPQNLEELEPFLPCPKDDATGKVIVNKTGMGSSAALVTSIVGALLQFFGAIDLQGEKNEEGLRIAHNLSQICHCHAQGKVGSGFDVSSAVYGSHVYTRFSKGVINEFLESVTMMTTKEDQGLQLSEALSKQLVELVNNNDDWDCTVSPVSLPPGLELLMADVCGGSESPSMARKILEWKKKNRKVGFMDDYYWKDLKRCNKKIVSLLSDQFTSQTFLDGLRRDGAMIISKRTAEQWKKPMPSSWHLFEGSSWDVALKLLDLRLAFLECRQNLKGMGEAAGVPIEPDEQSALADATMKLPGVVAAGIPGAGGYDALFVIYVKGHDTNGGKSDQVRDEIGNLWREMSDKNDDTVVCPLSVRAATGSRGGLCSTKLDW